MRPRNVMSRFPSSCIYEMSTILFAPFQMIRLATCCNVHRALSILPTNRLAVRVLSSHRPRSHETIRRSQGSTFDPETGKSTRVLSPRSQSTMAHPPSTPSAEPIIAQGEDEVLLKERMKALIADLASPGLWSMSPDRMGLERQISFRTFKLCWVPLILPSPPPSFRFTCCDEAACATQLSSHHRKKKTQMLT